MMPLNKIGRVRLGRCTIPRARKSVTLTTGFALALLLSSCGPSAKDKAAYKSEYERILSACNAGAPLDRVEIFTTDLVGHQGRVTFLNSYISLGAMVSSYEGDKSVQDKFGFGLYWGVHNVVLYTPKNAFGNAVRELLTNPKTQTGQRHGGDKTVSGYFGVWLPIDNAQKNERVGWLVAFMPLPEYAKIHPFLLDEQTLNWLRQ